MPNDWLEVRIPISPAEHYFNKVRVIARSIRSLGARYKDVAIRVTVGADQAPVDLYEMLPWSRDEGIRWHWVDRDDFLSWKATNHPYIATMMERFRPPFGANNILMLDADVIAIRPFDELLEAADKRPSVLAAPAHVGPFATEGMWRELYREFGLAEPDFTFPLMNGSKGPAYFNTGVLLAPAAVLEKLYEPYMAAIAGVRALMDSYYVEQIALPIALLKSGIPFGLLPPRYNFPNDPAYDNGYPNEFKAIAFLHFLRADIVDRDQDFASTAAIQSLAGREDLIGSNELLRRRVAEVLSSTAWA